MRFARSIMLLVSLFCAGARADLITFENVVSSGNMVWSSLVSGGFRFTGPHFHVLDDHRGLADDGSAIYIGGVGGGIDHAITMTRIGGGPFDVASIEAAALFQPGNMLTAFYPNATALRLTGFFSGGGSLSLDFQLDGSSFDHFDVAGLTGLSSLVINGVKDGGGEFAFAVDNIAVAPIPSPASAALGLLGVLGLVVHPRRR